MRFIIIDEILSDHGEEEAPDMLKPPSQDIRDRSLSQPSAGGHWSPSLTAERSRLHGRVQPSRMGTGQQTSC